MFWDESESGVGDLLVKAGVVSQAQLNHASKMAGNKKVQTGQMLIMAGYITPRDMQAAIDAEDMLRDHKIDLSKAEQCLKIACKTKRPFADVLREQASDGDSKR
ncbi:MAG TPA: hypothetical protein V6C81_14300 [Planktothrix sp.]